MFFFRFFGDALGAEWLAKPLGRAVEMRRESPVLAVRGAQWGRAHIVPAAHGILPNYLETPKDGQESLQRYLTRGMVAAAAKSTITAAFVLGTNTK